MFSFVCPAVYRYAYIFPHGSFGSRHRMLEQRQSRAQLYSDVDVSTQSHGHFVHVAADTQSGSWRRDSKKNIYNKYKYIYIVVGPRHRVPPYIYKRSLASTQLRSWRPIALRQAFIVPPHRPASARCIPIGSWVKQSKQCRGGGAELASKILSKNGEASSRSVEYNYLGTTPDSSR